MRYGTNSWCKFVSSPSLVVSSSLQLSNNFIFSYFNIAKYFIHKSIPCRPTPNANSLKVHSRYSLCKHRYEKLIGGQTDSSWTVLHTVKLKSLAFFCTKAYSEPNVNLRAALSCMWQAFNTSFTYITCRDSWVRSRPDTLTAVQATPSSRAISLTSIDATDTNVC